jgi:hypothetical protein
MPLDLLKRYELARGLTNSEEDANKTSLETYINAIIAGTSGYQPATALNALQLAGVTPEFGTFLPVISGSTSAGTGTYTAQVGRYQKIMNKYTAIGMTTISNHTGTGNIIIDNLPAAGLNVTNFYQSVSIGLVDGLSLTAGNYCKDGLIWPNTTYIVLYQVPVGGGSIATIPMDTAFSVYFCAEYFCN